MPYFRLAKKIFNCKRQSEATSDAPEGASIGGREADGRAALRESRTAGFGARRVCFLRSKKKLVLRLIE